MLELIKEKEEKHFKRSLRTFTICSGHDCDQRSRSLKTLGRRVQLPRLWSNVRERFRSNDLPGTCFFFILERLAHVFWHAYVPLLVGRSARPNERWRWWGMGRKWGLFSSLPLPFSLRTRSTTISSNPPVFWIATYFVARRVPNART